ncbi:MAG: hypothetical protein AAFW73_01415 [Bacteroidota bacterium]
MYRLLLFFLLLTACVPESENLTPVELQRVDTLYARKVERIRPVLDSLCEVRSDSLLRTVYDSLLREREREIEQILNRQ